ncbi:hypothetical protein UI24_23800 [Mycobacteroides franklinii]|nr:hypothetical protein [Mycobacteroides franklinii]
MTMSITLLAWVESGPNAHGEPSADELVFGYRALGELGLVKGAEVVARIDDRAPQPTYSDRVRVTGAPRFTDDGRYLFATAGDGQLAVIDTQNLATKTVSCPYGTSPVLPGGGSSVLWWEGADRLVSIDLSTEQPKPTLRQVINLPSPQPADGFTTNNVTPPTLAAARNGRVVLQRTETLGPYWWHVYLYLIEPDGSVQRLGRERANRGGGPVNFSPDGRSLVYQAVDRNGYNWDRSVLGLIDLRTGAHNTYAPRLAENDEVTSTELSSVLWQDNDTLRTRYQTSRGHSVPLSAPIVWELKDGRWKIADERPLVQKLTVSSDEAIVIVPNESRDDRGILCIERRGAYTRVANYVGAVVLPPEAA